MRTKSLPIGCMMVLLAIFTLVPGSAQSKVQVTLPDTTAAPGDTLDIPVVVDDVTGLGIIGVGLTITYTDTVLEALSATTTGTIAEGWGPPTVGITPGQITIGMASATALGGSGPLVYIKFTVNPVLPQGGISPLHFADVQLNEYEVPAESYDGSVTIPVPNIALSETALTFGDVEVNSSLDRTLWVYSVGTDTLEVDSLAVSGADYSVSPAAPPVLLLAPGDSLEVTVTFAPSAKGPSAGSLTIYSNDPDSPDTTVALSGNGVALPDIGVDPDSLDFGVVAVGDTSELTLAVDNYDGSDTLSVESISLGGTDYSVDGPPLPTLIAPGGQVLLTVAFSPSVEGEVLDTLRIGSNEIGRAHV